MSKDLGFRPRSFEFRRCGTSIKKHHSFLESRLVRDVLVTPQDVSSILDTMRTGRDWPVMWRSRPCDRQPFAMDFKSTIMLFTRSDLPAVTVSRNEGQYILIF
jgi:hypothetical protein